jgi:hypothetical protein
LTANLDIGLIDVPFAGNGAFAPIEALEQLWREMDKPAMDKGNGQRSSRRFFEIARAEVVSQVPA